MTTVYLCCEVIGGARCGLVGRFHTYCTCRHCKGCGCAVCVCKGNAAAYNFPLIKYLVGRSCTCGQSNGCTHCCLGDRSACTNGCSTACHGYIVLNSFPNCSYGSVSSNDNLVASSLFNTANAPSLELLTGRSSKAVCRERVFAGNVGDIRHRTGAAVRVKAHGVGRRRRVLMHELEDGFAAAVVCAAIVLIGTIVIAGALYTFRVGAESHPAADHGARLIAQRGERHRAAAGKVNFIRRVVFCLNNAIKGIIQCQINSRILDEQLALFNICCESLCAYRDGAVLNPQIAAPVCTNSFTV